MRRREKVEGGGGGGRWCRQVGGREGNIIERHRYRQAGR